MGQILLAVAAILTTPISTTISRRMKTVEIIIVIKHRSINATVDDIGTAVSIRVATTSVVIVVVVVVDIDIVVTGLLLLMLIYIKIIRTLS
jgi:hypothetical protein